MSYAGTQGKTIKLFLADGTPLGIMIAEIVNWTGLVLMGPRTQIENLVRRSELARTGLYFLTGPDPDILGKTTIYIGESDHVGKRLVQHSKDETKSFWEHACVVTSKDDNLTKAHVKYLESQLLKLSKSMNHAGLHNSTSPDYDGLPESDIADMASFIAHIRLILPALGHNFLHETQSRFLAPSVRAPNPDGRETLTALAQPSENIGHELLSPEFQIRRKDSSVLARAQQVNGEFIVLAGSEAAPRWLSSQDHNYAKQTDRLLMDGKLLKTADGSKARFAENTVFSAPSAAAAAVLGKPSRPVDWKTAEGLSYPDWQNQRLASLNLGSAQP